MGLFSSSSKTYVSSVTYPLGDDDPANRVDFTQYLVLNSLLQGRDLGPSLTRGYLTGGGMKFRSAYRYARDKYAQGLPQAGMLYAASPDRAVVIELLEGLESGQEIYLNTVYLTAADFTFWAERYLAQEYGYDRLTQRFTKPPTGVHVEATVSYDIERTGAINIILMNPDLSARTLKFYPKDLVSGGLYLHAVYQVVEGFPTEITQAVRAIEAGDTASTVVTVENIERDSDIQEITTKVVTVVGETETTITTERTIRTMSRPRYFSYLVGKGTYPTIDAWRTNQAIVNSPFYPSIPLRIDNVDFSNPEREGQRLYDTSKKLVQKVGVEYTKIADNIRTNENIKEIDFAFLQFGVALNTKTPEGKKYIYEFFKLLQTRNAVTQTEYETWEVGVTGAATTMTEYGGDPEQGGTRVPASGFGTTGMYSPPSNKLVLNDPDTHHRTQALNITLEWDWVKTTVHAGQIAAGARVGDCEVAVSGSAKQIALLANMVADNSLIYAVRQITPDSYEKITIAGLVYNNLVYKDQSVTVTAYDAMTKADEEGFILPLNHLIFRNMGMKDSTQLSYECMHLVLNCYQIVKKKWYQRGIFKVLLVALAVVFTVMSMGAATPLSAAMVSAAAGLTITFGISGILAAFIVATATVFAGMVLTKLLTPVFTDLFGEKWGQVLLVIASALAMNFAQTGNVLGSVAGSAPLTASRIIQGTSAVLQAYGGYVQGSLTELSLAGQELARAQKEEMDKLTAKIKELDTGTDLIDIQGLIDSTNSRFESPDDFFARTLITGSDVAELTLGQISHFADLGLQLPNTG